MNNTKVPNAVPFNISMPTLADTGWFNVGDTVWYMWGNKPQSNKVTGITIELTGSFSEDGSLLAQHTLATYHVSAWWGSLPQTRNFKVEDLFPDKQALMASL